MQAAVTLPGALCPPLSGKGLSKGSVTPPSKVTMVLFDYAAAVMPWGRGYDNRFSLTVVGETLARRLLQQSSDLATPSRATPTTASASTCSQIAPPQPSSAPKGKGSARGRNTKKAINRPTAPDHSPPDHAPPRHTPPLSISSSPEYISIASPANQISYGMFLN